MIVFIGQGLFVHLYPFAFLVVLLNSPVCNPTSSSFLRASFLVTRAYRVPLLSKVLISRNSNGGVCLLIMTPTLSTILSVYLLGSTMAYRTRDLVQPSS
jgi:hypothetical protein